ncbi:nucleotidyltransferase domain-containing protein [Actinoplanes regularis]|uniref:Nucleotidyltransferase domain-containing protein n=1 Tax=Actinoplanes regularis TaxID=52697 RepID=A0A239KFW4_9ACTN|nr:nucleotidyltransferase domain-containing protein [Actinoplanes regularis]GIE92487.1 hypothetical protein Are01nite_89670 [Actinoplanes regularis]SNT17071.1 Nucleotidyltransferase domain-containing protein [Actinoplanes regularis]
MTGLYRDLATPAFLAGLPRLAKALDQAVPELPGQVRNWVVYGSRITGAATPTSDIDVLMLHDNERCPPTRIDARYDEAPVTVYALPWSALQADGEHRTYGGYFALKLFSPFVCTQPGREEDLLASVACFLGPLATRQAGYKGTAERTRHQILADSYLAFLDLHPDFDSYVARTLSEPLLSSPIWLRQAQVMVDAYEARGLIRYVRAGRYAYAGTATVDDWCHERAIAAARFWAFGAVCHGADASFPDLYRDKARSRTTSLRRRSIVNAIQRISDGRSLR